jgi:hypothetical protein
VVDRKKHGGFAENRTIGIIARLTEKNVHAQSRLYEGERSKSGDICVRNLLQSNSHLTIRLSAGSATLARTSPFRALF